MILKKSFKDKAWGNTVSFAVEAILHPLLTTLCIVLSFCYLSWEQATLTSIIYYISYEFFVDATEFLRRWISDVKWCFNKKLRAMSREL
jgi:hypothetical protein